MALPNLPSSPKRRPALSNCSQPRALSSLPRTLRPRRSYSFDRLPTSRPCRLSSARLPSSARRVVPAWASPTRCRRRYSACRSRVSPTRPWRSKARSLPRRSASTRALASATTAPKLASSTPPSTMLIFCFSLIAHSIHQRRERRMHAAPAPSGSVLAQPPEQFALAHTVEVGGAEAQFAGQAPRQLTHPRRTRRRLRAPGESRRSAAAGSR